MFHCLYHLQCFQLFSPGCGYDDCIPCDNKMSPPPPLPLLPKQTSYQPPPPIPPKPSWLRTHRRPQLARPVSVTEPASSVMIESSSPRHMLNNESRVQSGLGSRQSLSSETTDVSSEHETVIYSKNVKLNTSQSDSEVRNNFNE